jgi:hypothetical protein
MDVTALSTLEQSKHIEVFIDTLHRQLIQNQLNPRQLQLIGEFLILYTFQENHVIDTSPMDLKKYILMGWYIYRVLNE